MTNTKGAIVEAMEFLHAIEESTICDSLSVSAMQIRDRLQREVIDAVPKYLDDALKPLTENEPDSTGREQVRNISAKILADGVRR